MSIDRATHHAHLAVLIPCNLPSVHSRELSRLFLEQVIFLHRLSWQVASTEVACDGEGCPVCAEPLSQATAGLGMRDTGVVSGLSDANDKDS